MTGSLITFQALELLNTLLERDGRLSLFDVFGTQQFELTVSAGAITRFWHNWQPCYDEGVVRGFLLSFGAIDAGRFKLRYSGDFEFFNSRARREPEAKRLLVPLFDTLLQAGGLRNSRFNCPDSSVQSDSADAASRWRPAKLLIPREHKLKDHLHSFLALAGTSLRDAPTLAELRQALSADEDWVRGCLHALGELGALERVQIAAQPPAQHLSLSV